MFTVYGENTSRQRSSQELPQKISSKRCLKIELKRIREHWSDFCNVTSVHGVRYLADSDRPLIERLWWAAVLATCFYYATIYAVALCKRWLDSPIEHISVIKYEHVVRIPLPAVTFCNNMKSTSNEKTETFLFLCGLDTSEIKDTTEYNYSINVENMIEMAPPFNCSCKLHYQHPSLRKVTTSDCSRMFTRVITQNGVCYSFNMMDPKEIFREGVISNYEAHDRRSDWDPDSGYKKDAELKDPPGSSQPFADGPYPKRANSNPLLNISFRTLFNGSFCRNEGPGIQVVVHGPNEMPVIGHREAGWILANDDNTLPKGRKYTNLRYDFEYAIELDPERTWASDGLRIFKPHQRKCFFNGEKKLAFFKFYTKTNCENECLINRTVNNCECVDFYMPHFESTRTCHTESEIECIVETMDWWERRGKTFCNCYPSCNDINYNAFIFGKNVSCSNPRNDMTHNLTISIYNADDFYMSKENKQSQWTIVDLIASCGGVFGLFCGMSLIGVIEFLYYGTIRVVTNIIRRRREHRRRIVD